MDEKPIQHLPHDARPFPQQRGWLAVDVDGVLANHVDHVLPVLAREFAIRFTSKQIRTWDFPIGNTTFGEVLRNKQRTPQFILSTPLVDGAREAMQTLSERYHIAVVTARPPESDKYTQEWLETNDIPYDTFANLREGTKHLTSVPCNLLIDDYDVNIAEFLGNTQGSAILFSQPWNSDHFTLEPFLAARRLTLASTWHEVVESVTTMLPLEAIREND